MHNPIDWQRLWWCCCIAAAALLMLKLLLTRLYRCYPAFGLYVLFTTAMSIALTALRLNGTSHLALWACGRPVDWVLRYLVIVELYSMVWSRYPGLGTMMKWIALIVFAGAALLSSLVLWDLFRNPNWRMLPLQFSFAAQSVVDWMMASAALVPMIVALGLRLRERWNVVVHGGLLALLLGCDAFTMLGYGIFGRDLTPQIHTVPLAVNAGCMLAWALLLRRPHVAPAISPAAPMPEAQALGQLHDLKETLARLDILLRRKPSE